MRHMLKSMASKIQWHQICYSFWQLCCRTYFKPQLEQLQVQYAFVCSHFSTQKDSIQLIPGQFGHFYFFSDICSCCLLHFQKCEATGKKQNLALKKKKINVFSFQHRCDSPIQFLWMRKPVMSPDVLKPIPTSVWQAWYIINNAIQWAVSCTIPLEKQTCRSSISLISQFWIILCSNMIQFFLIFA